jgi:hypothetical protein
MPAAGAAVAADANHGMTQAGISPVDGSMVMAKGQKKSNKEARKPKAEKKKTIAANPSTKEGTVRGLENFKN